MSKPLPLTPQQSAEQSSFTQSCSDFLPQYVNTDEKMHKTLVEVSLALRIDGGEQIQQAINKLIFLLEKINFLKANHKDYNKKIQLISYYNLSCAYQILTFTRVNNHIDKCLRYIQKSIELLKDLLRYEDHHWFKLSLLLIKIQLQYCALLSQAENHQKALDIGIQVNDNLLSLFDKGLASCLRELDADVVISDDTVSFSHNVLEKAKEKLIDLASLDSYSIIMETNHAQFKRIKENSYYWKTNSENNEKTFRKQLQAPLQQKKSTRTILGLKTNDNWIQQMTIGQIMSMKPLNYIEVSEPDNIVYEFNYRNMIEKIILVSVSYFSIATQMRFIENAKQKHIQNKKQLRKSEIFHLKSIEITCKNIRQGSLFVNHLINSYQRHYCSDLVTIEEEPSCAEYSMMSSHPEKKQNLPNGQEQNFIYYENKCQRILRKSDQNRNPLVFKKKKSVDVLSYEKEAEDNKYILFDKSAKYNLSSKQKTIRKTKVTEQKQISSSHHKSFQNQKVVTSKFTLFTRKAKSPDLGEKQLKYKAKSNKKKNKKPNQ